MASSISNPEPFKILHTYYNTSKCHHQGLENKKRTATYHFGFRISRCDTSEAGKPGGWQARGEWRIHHQAWPNYVTVCVVVLTELRGQYKSVARVTDYHALATSFLLYISKKEMHLAARRWSRGNISQTPAFVSNQSSSRSCWIIYTQVAMPFDTPTPPPLTTTIITFNRTAAIRPRCIQQTPLSDIFIPRLQDLI